MFKKLILLVVLCMSIQFIHAQETPESLIDNLQIEKVLLKDTYIDDECALNIFKVILKNPCTETTDCLYTALSSFEGKLKLAKDISECSECTKDWGFKNNIRLHIPKESLLVILEKTPEGTSFVDLYYASKDFQLTTIKLITEKNISSKNLKKFLSSQVIQNAIQKAGGNLTETQINQLVELK